ncbi:11225_t:CDS:2 [Ambispora gerdemannii]|uniref:11225_t:CDS:1 n=1 Tax=Ambispora gerdemannii TaxID=144530 RepID=A0A9N8YZM7_9GLOM|nr:11225_t:CDS:2 [Ambispora gerdemannii]
MSTATPLQTTKKSSTTTTNGQQPSKRPGIRKIMTWNYRQKDKKPSHLGYNSAPEDDPQAPPPASPTPSFKSVKNGRPSLFAAFARRNSTKSLSENSTRSRSPTSPRPSTEYGISVDGFRTPSPTPSRNSMIFERDIEYHDHLSVPEAIDIAIPPVLDTLASDEIPTILAENGIKSYDDEHSDGGPWAPSLLETIEKHKRSSSASSNSNNIINNQLDMLRPPSPSPFDTPLIAETLRGTSPKVMNELAAGAKETNEINGINDNP